jgi:hypothetical protein
MSGSKLVAGLIALILLGSYLLLRHRERVRNRRNNLAGWTGQAMDVTRLTPRLNQVRQDYFAFGRFSRPGLWYRYRLLALAARTVGQLSFFRNKPEHDLHHGDA